MRRQCPAGVWLERIESVVGDGHPDVNVYSLSRVSFVELKAPTAPVSDDSLLLVKGDVRLSQINWHLKAATLQLNTYFLIRDSKGLLYLIPGGYASELERITTARTKEMSIASTWTEIWEILQ
jgi:hypothetical protein